MSLLQKVASNGVLGLSHLQFGSQKIALFSSVVVNDITIPAGFSGLDPHPGPALMAPDPPPPPGPEILWGRLALAFVYPLDNQLGLGLVGIGLFVLTPLAEYQRYSAGQPVTDVG